MHAKNKRDFLGIRDFTVAETNEIFKLAAALKRKPIQTSLKNKTIGLIFSKSSTRTRVSFEVGVHQLGGRSLFLSPSEIQLGRGETVEDTAKVLSRYLDGIVIRTFSHDEVVTFAKNATIPVINGLTDLSHPCQVLTDIFTIIEKLKTYKNKKIVFVGDCKNNMAHSWIMAAGLLGLHLVLTGHPDYMPEEDVLETAAALGEKSYAIIETMVDPEQAVEGAHVINTDVWTSMGQEKESAKRIKDLAPWQVNDDLMKRADKKVIFMHCLPAHRGEEVTASVIDGTQSVVFDQAENRLHVQKAIMTFLMKA